MSILDNLRIRDDSWFALHQDVLLKLANNERGRSLLGIRDGTPHIIKITKESVTWVKEIDMKNDRVEFATAFRIGAPYADAVRRNWNQILPLASYLSDYVFLSPLARQARALVATTSTFMPDPDPETTTVDGRVWRTANETWATLRSASAGTSVGDSTAWFTVNVQRDTGAPNYNIFRSFVLFNTASIPDTDAISSATLELTGDTLFDGIGDAYSYAVMTGAATPASDTALVLDDFDQAGSTVMSDTQDLTGWTAGVKRSFTLNASGIANISKTGISRFGLKEGHDQENQDIGTGINQQSGIDWRSADRTGTGDDPLLTVIHAAAASAAASRLSLLGVR